MPAITFEPVSDEYEWGMYYDFKVLIMKRNGYFNATKLCNDGGKRFKDWLKNKSSTDMIEYLSTVLAPKVANAIIMVTDVDNDYRGTYVHEDLITSIASWISPKFAFKVHKIVKEYHISEVNTKYKVEIAQKDKIIDNKTLENMSLKEMLQKVLDNSEHSHKENVELKLSVSNLTDEVSKLSLDNKISHEKHNTSIKQLNNIQHTLDIVIEDRVVKPKDNSKTNSIVIYESIDQGPNMFYIFRVQKRDLKAALKRYLDKNPNAVKFAEIEYNPNSINYFIRFKEQLKNNIKWHYNTFELSNITKDQLKEFIAKINEEKYELKEMF